MLFWLKNPSGCVRFGSPVCIIAYKDEILLNKKTQKNKKKKELVVVVVVVAVYRHMEYTWADVVRTIQCFKSL